MNSTRPTSTRPGATAASGRTLRATRVSSEDERCPWCHDALSAAPELQTWRCEDCSAVSHVVCSPRCETFGCGGVADEATAALHHQLAQESRPEASPVSLARLLDLGRQPLRLPELSALNAGSAEAELARDTWRARLTPLLTLFGLLLAGLVLAVTSVAVFVTLGIFETFCAALIVTAVTGLVVLPRHLRERLARPEESSEAESLEGDRRLELRRARRVRPGLGRSL